jgi:putative transposase
MAAIARPGVLRAGDEVRVDGRLHTVVALSGTSARLVDNSGATTVILLPQLLSDPTFMLVNAARAPLPPLGALDGIPEQMLEQAHWWERHLVEVLTGLPPDVEQDVVAKPTYDPSVTTLRQRELSKVTELAAQGRRVSLATVQRLRRRYEREGLWALVDQRTTRGASQTGRVDPRIVQAAQQAIAGETNQSTGTVGRLRRRTEQLLAATHGADAPPMPSIRTFYRLAARLSEGRHTFGSARTRRSLAKRPDDPFGRVTALRPGELVEIDSTPLDVRVLLDNGLVDRVELTGVVDLATRTISAAVLRPTTKAVDAALLLARTMTPEPMRPGWADALRMARSVLPHRSLISLDERLEHAAARPVIVPETIICDHGKAFMSQTFRQACRALGINLQPRRPDTPTDGPYIERTLESVASLFCQFVAGYVGSSVERRGKHAEQQAAWSMLELQALLDEWLVTTWQNRPHDGLRHPLTPGKMLTPNEQYAALVGVAGYVPVALSPDDYVELLPVVWRSINAYGVKIDHRTYDAKALNPYRQQRSGALGKRGRQGKWEVHHDPYDISRIWVRDHWEGGWITATWTHLHTVPAPFGELAWRHSMLQLGQRGQDPVTEQEIAQAAHRLLDRAEHGPEPGAEHRPATRPTPTKRDRRVAGRTRATAGHSGPRPVSDPADDSPADILALAGQDDQGDQDLDQDAPAEVVPLPIFNAREEAAKWW